MPQYIRSPNHSFAESLIDLHNWRLLSPRAFEFGRSRVREKLFLLRIGWLLMRDAEQMPLSIFRTDECVIVDVPGIALSNRRIVNFMELADLEDSI